jgi:hypothetical protein
MCCTPTVRLLIVLTLPPRYRRPLKPATGLSALAPAQRAGAQRLRSLAQPGPQAVSALAPAIEAIADTKCAWSARRDFMSTRPSRKS